MLATASVHMPTPTTTTMAVNIKTSPSYPDWRLFIDDDGHR
jgi:hypothetical protein